MLIGSYSSVLSVKRRTAVPKKFLVQLGKKVVLAKWYEGCLVLVSENEWLALLNKLTGKSEIVTQNVRDTDRFIIGSAFEVEPDDQGRIVIPKPLVDYARLGLRLSFIGLGQRVEIWDEAEWKKRENYISLNAGKFIEKISNEK